MSAAYILHIVLFVLPFLVSSFRLPIHIVFDQINTLENIVNSKAVVSTVTSRMNMEIINENILFQQLLSVNHFRLNFDLFYLTILTASWYSRYAIDIKSDDAKLSDIPIYNNTRKMTNMVLFISLIILTKNVENAI